MCAVVPDADAGASRDRAARVIGVLVSGRGHEPAGADRRGPADRRRSRRTRRTCGRSSGRGRPASRPRSSSSTTTPTARRATRRWPTGSTSTASTSSSAPGTCTCCGAASSSASRGAIVNTHSAPLPGFPGPHPIDDVLAAGVARDRGDGALRRRRRRHRPGDRRRARAGAPERRRAHAERARPGGRAPAAAAGRPRSDRVMRARCISVYDKTGLERVRARAGRARRRARRQRRNGGVPREARRRRSRRSRTLTEVPELLGGRGQDAAPAHPRGILARRDRPDDSRARRARHRAVRPRLRNLYPFADGRRAARRARAGRGRDDRHRRPGDAARGGEELRARRRRSAGPSGTRGARGAARSAASSRSRRGGGWRRETFAVTAAYEAAIADWFSRRARRSRSCSLPVFDEAQLDLAYGENPHQRAAYYAEVGARRHLLSRVEQLARARALVQQPERPLGGAAPAREFELPACVIVKHANPCGVAVAGVDRAGVRAGAGRRPRVGVRRRRGAQPAGQRGAGRAARRAVRRGAVRAGLRRGGAGARSRQKPATRILEDRERRRCEPGRARLPAGARRPARAGARLPTSTTAREWRSSAASADEMMWGDLLFAWRVCKHVTLERDRARAATCRRSGSAPGR